MAVDITITITVRGIANHPEVAAQRMLPNFKRALYCVDGVPGKFSARIDMPGGSIELGENGEWRTLDT